MDKLERERVFFSTEKTEYYCNICERYVTIMTENTGSKDTWASKKYKVIGAGFRDNNTCPVCFSTDRHRFLNYYISNYTDLYDLSIKAKVLHFSPEKTIKERLMNTLDENDYYPSNIIPGIEKYNVDIMDIHFDDNFFDYVICSYILEHVVDDNKAISEIYRVLKETGEAIVSFPLTLIHNTIEGNGNESPKERERLFCQEDHCRLYGMDVVEKFKKVGFSVSIFRLSEKKYNELKNNRFIKGDTLFILKKIS